MERSLELLIDSIDRDPLRNPMVKLVGSDSNLTIPLQVKKIAESIVDPRQAAMEKYEAIYNWIHENFIYDENLRRTNEGGRLTSDDWPNVINILKNKGGICCNMAQLYISFAKSVGLEARYARIIVDCKGEKVNHACAFIGTKEDGNPHYVDPAYNSFDVLHQYAKIKDNVGTNQRIMESLLRKPWDAYNKASSARDWETLVVLGDQLSKFEPLESDLLTRNTVAAFCNMGVDLSQAGYKDLARKSWELCLEYDASNVSARNNLDSFA